MRNYSHNGKLRRQIHGKVLLALILTTLLFVAPVFASDGNAEHTQTSTVQGHEATGAQANSGYNFHAMQNDMARELPIWSCLPFVGMLLSIALFPLMAPHFWHHHYAKVSLFWALSFIIPFLYAYQSLAIYEIIHIYLIDYIPFIVLLWGLFTVSGGILLRGNLVGKPIVNLVLLTIGTLLASWMGTTGAAMLMIRPILRANAHREKKMHIVIFFIFLVANIGGSLTPLGDPPLFLGFLHGVPFFWTLTHLMPHFVVATVILLAIFFVFDTIVYNKEKPVAPKHEKIPLRLEGSHNFLFLGGILFFVLLSGTWKPGHVMVYGVHLEYQNLTRDVGIIFMGILSLLTTAKFTRKDNEFSWFPILEVAYLFAGIFATIIPMLSMLRAGSDGALGMIIDHVKSPAHYFWITGILSSFLDNAPTYLTFFNLALGRLGLSEAEASAILIAGQASPFIVDLVAISVGAVFFGAFTYIGNAPNFMTRSIAESAHIKMPSFFGYMLWSIAILIPVFIVITLIFFLTGSVH